MLTWIGIGALLLETHLQALLLGRIRGGLGNLEPQLDEQQNTNTSRRQGDT